MTEKPYCPALYKSYIILSLGRLNELIIMLAGSIKTLFVKLIQVMMQNYIFQSEESHTHQSKHHNGIKDNIHPTPPLLSPKSACPDFLNSTGQNIATISNIDIDIQPQEHREKVRNAKPPRPASAAAKRTEKEEKKKEDTNVPRPHPRKQVSGVIIAKEEHSGLSGTVPHKHTERPEPVKDSRTPNVNTSVEEDTMKLLQQAAMEDVKNDKQDTTEGKKERKAEAERHLGDRGVC